MSKYYLEDVEYDAPNFLRELAAKLLETPGGWGGVSDDLENLAATLDTPKTEGVPMGRGATTADLEDMKRAKTTPKSN